MTFKAGDKVRRIKASWGEATKGFVYTVSEFSPGCLSLACHTYTYCPDAFELVASAAPEPSASKAQVGGDHYVKLAIQPMEYSMANKLDACQHTIVKYITRFRDKGGLQDLLKIKHTVDLLIEREYKDVE